MKKTVYYCDLCGMEIEPFGNRIETTIEMEDHEGKRFAPTVCFRVETDCEICEGCMELILRKCASNRPL